MCLSGSVQKPLLVPAYFYQPDNSRYDALCLFGSLVHVSYDWSLFVPQIVLPLKPAWWTLFSVELRDLEVC